MSRKTHCLALAICATLLAVAALLAGCVSGPAGSISDESARASSAERSSNVSSGGNSQGAVSQDASEPSTAPTLSISSADDRALINGFLDVFSETLSPLHASYDPGRLSAAENASFIVNAAFSYYGHKDFRFFESGSYTDVEGFGNEEPHCANERMEADPIQEFSKEFFGCEADLDALSGGYGGFSYEDGYVYTRITAPYSQSCLYSAVTEVEDLGECRYELAFDTLTNNYLYGLLPSDEKLDLEREVYPLEADEMMRVLGVEKPSYPGVAVVKVQEDASGKSIVLESYSCNQVETVESAPTSQDAQPDYPCRATCEAGEEVALSGTLHITEDGPIFSGKGMWAYVELPCPLYITGGSYYGSSVQSNMQVALDFYFEPGGERNLELPDWEPYDGKEVVVRGTVKEVRGMSINQMGCFTMPGAQIESVLDPGTVASYTASDYGLDDAPNDGLYLVPQSTSGVARMSVLGNCLAVVGSIPYSPDEDASFDAAIPRETALAIPFDDDTYFTETGDTSVPASGIGEWVSSTSKHDLYIIVEDGKAAFVGPVPE